MTLRVRMAGAAGIAVAIVAVALAAGAYWAARAELRGEVDRSLVDRISAFEHGPGGGRSPDGGGSGGGDSGSNRTTPPPFGGAPGSLQVVAKDGTTTRPTGDAAVLPVDARTRAIAAAGTGRAFRDVTVSGVHLRVVAVGAGTRGAIQIARPMTEVDNALERLLVVLGAFGAAGVIGAAILGSLVARTALAPVRLFTRRTEQIAGDPDLSHRLEPGGRDELGRLARTFNTTLDALERSVEAQRNLIADAGHELRTPLASLRANVQVLEHADRLPPAERAALREDIVLELDELTALVGDVVELARGTRPAQAIDDVRLDSVATSLVERYGRRAGDAISFTTDLDESVVAGEPERIARAISNLIDNAVKWSPRGGSVEVSVQGGVVAVRDHGPGFGVDDLPHVFDRFYRATNARGTPGSGLGLAIVRQAAESHGGTAWAENAPGGGAIVRVRFAPAPVAPRATGS